MKKQSFMRKQPNLLKLNHKFPSISWQIENMILWSYWYQDTIKNLQKVDKASDFF